MADISLLSRLVAGVQRQVDLSANSLVVGSLKVGSSSPAELTKTILENLIALQNGSDFSSGTNAHTHDGRYFTETELSDAVGPATGSDLIGDDDNYDNFTPTAATVKGALEGIDDALAATADEKVAVSANDTTPGYVEQKFVVDNGTNSSNPLEATTLNDGGDEDYRIRFDQSKVDHGALAGLADDDHTIYIKADGTRAFSGDQSMGGNQLTNVGDPASAQDAATKAYVDAVAMGLKPKAAVRAASTANVAIATALEDGDSLDGITLAEGDRVLLKDQSDASENGIYIVSNTGAAARSADFDSLTPIDEINGAWVAVQEGTANAGKVFVQVGTVATLDTDDIVFTYWDPIASLTGGDMITKSGNDLSVDLAAVSGLESSNPGNAAGQLRVKLEASNPSLRITGSNELAAKLDAAGAIASGASGLAAQVDNSTIEINSNALRVKDAGITAAKLAAAVAGAGLTGGAGSALAVGAGDGITVNADDVAVNTTAIAGAGLENDGSNNLRIATSAYDGSTITGGGGSAAAVQRAPLVKRSLVAGESMAANTSFVVRWALNGETAGRVYKADKDASSTNKYMGIGIAHSAAGVTAGQSIEVTMLGEHALGSSDSAFNAADVGKELFIGASGAFILGSALAGTTNEAAFCIGVIQATDKIWVDFKNLRGIA